MINSSFIIFYAMGSAVVLCGSALMFVFAARLHALKIRRAYFLIPAIFFLYIPIAQLLKYHALGFYADFGHWMQVLWQIRETGIPWSPNVDSIDPGFGIYFAAHFVPFIYVVALPFLLFPVAKTVIAVNILVMFSAVVPLFLIARRRLGIPLAYVVSALFLLYPTLHYTVLYEF